MHTTSPRKAIQCCSTPAGFSSRAPPRLSGTHQADNFISYLAPTGGSKTEEPVFCADERVVLLEKANELFGAPVRVTPDLRRLEWP